MGNCHLLSTGDIVRATSSYIYACFLTLVDRTVANRMLVILEWLVDLYIFIIALLPTDRWREYSW